VYQRCVDQNVNQIETYTQRTVVFPAADHRGVKSSFMKTLI